MIISWKQFWSSEERIVLSICLLGVAFGLTIGILCKDWGESFHSIEIIGYQIPSLISFGVVTGLSVQLVSAMLIRIMMSWNSKLYIPITWWLFGISLGILTIFNMFSDRLVSFGFISAYIPDLLLFPVIMVIVGFDAMNFLAVEALYLIPFHIVSTGIIWLIDFGRSSV